MKYKKTSDGFIEFNYNCICGYSTLNLDKPIQGYIEAVCGKCGNSEEIKEGDFKMVAGVYLRANSINQLREKKKAFIYVRTASEGASTDNQERACIEYAIKNEIEVVRTYRDVGVSSNKKDKIGLTEMINALNDETVGTIIIIDIDRLSRNMDSYMKLLELFDSKNVRLLTARKGNSTNMTELRSFHNISKHLMAKEKELIRQRTIFGIKFNRKRPKK